MNPARRLSNHHQQLSKRANNSPWRERRRRQLVSSLVVIIANGSQNNGRVGRDSSGAGSVCAPAHTHTLVAGVAARATSAAAAHLFSCLSRGAAQKRAHTENNKEKKPMNIHVYIYIYMYLFIYMSLFCSPSNSRLAQKLLQVANLYLYLAPAL